MNYILAPVETTSRDYQWKLNAFFDSQSNKVLIIGQADIINSLLYFFPKVLYLGKNLIQHGNKKASHLTDSYINQLAKKGSKLIFIDEEGGLFNLNSKFASSVSLARHPIHKLPPFSLVCLWGRVQEKIISSYYNKHSFPSDLKLLTSGHPRFRQLSAKSKSDITTLMNSRFGKYVLFNTNFSLLTSNDLGKLFSSSIGWRNDLDSINQYLSIYNYESSALALFIDCLKYANNNLPQDVSILIKIHPGESPNVYKFIASHLPRVKLIQETFIPIHYWILGSLYSVSSRCTTALEATALHQPHISLRPISLQELECDTPLLKPSSADTYSLKEYIQKHNQYLKTNPTYPPNYNPELSKDIAFTTSSELELNLSDQLNGTRYASNAYEEILLYINIPQSSSLNLLSAFMIVFANSLRFSFIFLTEKIIRNILSIPKKGSLKFVPLNNSDFLFLASPKIYSKRSSARFYIVNLFSLVQVIIPCSSTSPITLKLLHILSSLFSFVFLID